jgi:hypothetical protein
VAIERFFLGNRDTISASLKAETIRTLMFGETKASPCSRCHSRHSGQLGTSYCLFVATKFRLHCTVYRMEPYNGRPRYRTVPAGLLQHTHTAKSRYGPEPYAHCKYTAVTVYGTVGSPSNKDAVFHDGK